MNRKLATIGLTVTTVYTALICVWVFRDPSAFSTLTPNSVGDLLAGVFGPIAVLWLILGFFQQGEELRQNTKALELQAEELRNSVEQQRELVLATKEQLLQEQIRHNESMSPRILFNGCGGGIKNGFGAYDVEVSNTGAMSSAVKLKFSQGVRSLSQDGIPQFPNGGHFLLHIVFEAEFPKIGDTVIVSFIDAVGRPGEVLYEIEMNIERTHCQIVQSRNQRA